jgi:hypothetical protein
MISLLEQLLEKEDIFKPFTFEEWVGRMVSAGIWTKNIDGTYSAEGDVDLSDRKLTKLPIRFKEVGGDFECSFNQLTSLEGAPEKVGGGFYCEDNQLTSLEGAPQKVGGYFYCSYNQLTTLEGAPQEVGGDFGCRYNKLTTPKGIGIVKGRVYCSDNPVSEKELLKTIGR